MLRYCAMPGCGVLVERGYCPTHARQQDRQRGTAHERGYTAAWAARSKRFRQQHPICGERHDGTMDTVHSECAAAGLTTPAQCVDHIVSKANGGTDDEENLMSACTRCNVAKRNRLERR